MRKQTVKTSRVAAQLEKMFRLLNEHFYNGQLPEVIISLKKTVGAYGHFTCGKVWQAGNERRYEINISSATLAVKRLGDDLYRYDGISYTTTSNGTGGQKYTFTQANSKGLEKWVETDVSFEDVKVSN